MRNLFWCSFLFLGVLLPGEACFGETTRTQLKFEKFVVCQTIEHGTNLRIKIVTSGQSQWPRQRREVVKELNQIINSGDYNIVSVKTSYSNTFLTSAEVKYSVVKDSKHQNLRIKFFHSQSDQLSVIEKEIKPKLDEFVNSGNYNIQEVNSIMSEGYLVAAEVYYYEE